MTTFTDVRHFTALIGGEQVDAERRIEIHDPSNEALVATVACGDTSHIDAAVDAAAAAYRSGAWSRLDPAERAAIMRKIADQVGEQAEELVELEMSANGATVRQATGFHIGYVAPHLSYFADLAERFEWTRSIGTTSFPTLAQRTVHREPIGVVGAITPFNFPLLLGMWKIGPALAAGNSVVVKPDERTPLSTLAFARIAEECGLPPGVLNVVPGLGSDAGARLASHPGVGKVAFTGSTEVGREIMRLASGTVKKVTLELGGKSPAIVLDDADLELAVDGILYGGLLYSGQVCESNTRLLVADSVYDEFVERCVDRMSTIQLGETRDWETDLGPVVSRKQRDRILDFVTGAQEEGATVAYGGGVPAGDTFERGHWVEPTLLVDVDNQMRVAREEVFGPVLSVLRYSNEAEALEVANDSQFGLAATIWSGDNERALDLASQIEAGSVWINDAHGIQCDAPFGGYKQSGLGRELGANALDEYTETKSVQLDLSGRRDRRAYDVLLSHAD